MPLHHRTRAVREAEEDRLAALATRSAASRGRERPEEPDPYRTAFERDRDRVLHSKAFRRLKRKTQVFIAPDDDHYVTRMTHALQVTQVARALAASLGLNEPLTEAIALAHDIGHTPFGHTGEAALDPFFPGWHHAEQGVRVLSVLEDRNLTWEVRDGIRAHSWSQAPPPATPEGTVVRLADRIAYLSHDALDAMRAGLLAESDVPAGVTARLGAPGSGWVGAMITAAVEHSVATGAVSMDPEVLEVMARLRAFMFERVYLGGENATVREVAVGVVRDLVRHHEAHVDAVPDGYRDPQASSLRAAVDYVAGMTDRYAINRHRELFGTDATTILARLPG